MTAKPKIHIAVHILTGLVTLAFVASAGFKLSGAKAVLENFEKLHLLEFRVPIGILELGCALLFAIPKTSSLGTLLLTGYLGGAVVAHLTSNDAGGMAPALILGLVMWAANYLRNQQMFESITRA
jgi:hypothetical protein